ncbi:MAG: hypothetical protein ACFBWO_04460 [Paracoccaceae bacterium]
MRTLLPLSSLILAGSLAAPVPAVAALSAIPCEACAAYEPVTRTVSVREPATRVAEIAFGAGAAPLGLHADTLALPALPDAVGDDRSLALACLGAALLLIGLSRARPA